MVFYALIYSTADQNTERICKGERLDPNASVY